MKQTEFTEGLKDGLPIGLGYLSVSFTLGMVAVSRGIPVLSAVFMSMTNLTSAGQANGISIMAVFGSFIELALCQIIINLRYALMSLSISQRLDSSVKFSHRFFIAYAMTDEIFAVMAARKQKVTLSFYTGLMLLPFIGWSLGTLLGGIFGGLIPENFTAVLSIALYGMFIAIIIPPAKKEKSVMVAVIMAAVMSSAIYYIPFFSFISEGISVIICAVIASAVCAVLFPREVKE